MHYLIVADGGSDPSQGGVFGPFAGTVLTPKARLEHLIIQAGRDVDANHDLATITATAQGGSPCVVQAQAIAPTG